MNLERWTKALNDLHDLRGPALNAFRAIRALIGEPVAVRRPRLRDDGLVVVWELAAMEDPDLMRRVLEAGRALQGTGSNVATSFDTVMLTVDAPFDILNSPKWHDVLITVRIVGQEDVKRVRDVLASLSDEVIPRGVNGDDAVFVTGYNEDTVSEQEFIETIDRALQRVGIYGFEWKEMR